MGDSLGDEMVSEPVDKEKPKPGYQHPALTPEDFQRWCIIRKYGENPESLDVKIKITHASGSLMDILPEGDWKGFFTSRVKDELAWWNDFEKKQFPLPDFRIKLEGDQVSPPNFLK